MKINRIGDPNPRHTLAPTPQEQTDLQISHERYTRFGRFYAGIGYSRLDDEVSGTTTSDVTGFILKTLDPAVTPELEAEPGRILIVILAHC